jgi:uncharacterized membrane protein
MTHAASRAVARVEAAVSNAIKPDVTPEDGTRQATGFVPTSRLDALTDAVFAFAMTLLVINIELPDDFHPKTTQAFLQGLACLSDTFIAYLITFLVLVAFWTGRAQKTYEPEMASAAYVRATLFHLLWVTVLPFSMLAVSRYDVAGAVWLYGANMILLAVTGILISRAAKRDSGREDASDGRVEFGLLIASALLSMLISLVSPNYAILAYLLNFAAPFVRRRVEQR